MLLPQRYIFSSKSQLKEITPDTWKVVVATTKVHIFKQITTNNNQLHISFELLLLPQRYIFSSKSQLILRTSLVEVVVVATTKVHIFKQITTYQLPLLLYLRLLLLPQRYIFSSKSQRQSYNSCLNVVVVATTKVHIFKQITTANGASSNIMLLLLLPQRYIFSSKSQRLQTASNLIQSCCCYHKGTYFQANHNQYPQMGYFNRLLLLPQRYIFSSKSQLVA